MNITFSTIMLLPLLFSGGITPKYSEKTEAYFKYYDLDIKDSHHSFGKFYSNGFNIATHIYRPKKNNIGELVVLVHGYCDHSGTMKHVIKGLTAVGYNVAVFDLPGHGLSSGKRGDIDDFATYANVLHDLIKICGDQFKGPVHLLGHSTGGATIIEYLLSKKDNQTQQLGKVILCAPLIRSNHWHLSKFGNAILPKNIVSVKKVFRDNSSDKQFLKFIKYQDPLQVKNVPLSWTRAMYSWNRRIPMYAKSGRDIMVIQGSKDSTVAWKYNLKALKRKFSTVNIQMIKGGRHQILNEAQPMQALVLTKIIAYLEGS